MAFSLPYPDMDFVPLDILTAQEQDQLVANIEYIADQFPINTENIADDAITADKIASNTISSDNIDWATMIPQSVNTEIDTKIKYDNKTIYAQRFVGTSTIIANSTSNITLIRNIAEFIDAIGWVKPGDNFSKSRVGTSFVGGNGSSIIATGGHYIYLNTSNEITLRITYNTGGNASYDVVVFYLKD